MCVYIFVEINTQTYTAYLPGLHLQTFRFTLQARLKFYLHTISRELGVNFMFCTYLLFSVSNSTIQKSLPFMGFLNFSVILETLVAGTHPFFSPISEMWFVVTPRSFYIVAV